MRKLLTAATLIGLSAVALFAYAQSSGCISVNYSSFCAPPGGSVVEHNYSAVCGVGQCVKNNYSVVCSSVPGGGAVVENFSAKCVGGCVPARSDLCVKPQ